MAEHEAREIGLREARAVLGDIAHAAATERQITYLTSHGRRVAAVVPAARAESLEAVDVEQAAREATIRLVDDVISEADPDLRDSLMIQLGTSGLLQIPAERRNRWKTMLSVDTPSDAPIEVVKWRHQEEQ